MRGGGFVTLPLSFFDDFLTLIFERELHRCDMFFSPALTQNHAWLRNT
jgi:hypothetical protein